MNTLRKLITIKDKQPVEESREYNEDITDNSYIKTYHSQGYEDSINSSGNPVVLGACLNDVFQKYKEECRINEEEQNKLKQPYKESLSKETNELSKLETAKEIKESELSDLEKKIQKIENDIAQVKIEPNKYGIDASSKPKAQFYIGLLVLVPITIYLVVFYMSASYSAFFKEFNSDELQAAIFDANAFAKALKDGVLESIFVSTIPFAFMGLGYLIHMFQKEKKGGKYKIATLFVVTFIFDLILAYQIELKIYDFNKTLGSPEFNLQIAFQRIEFWGIIFAGFVVYIIWGFVFDFIMKEYDNFDKINVFIRKLNEDKENLLSEKNKIKKIINELKIKITEIKGEIKSIQAKIDGFIFPKRKYLLLYAEYTKSWYLAIQQEIIIVRKEKERLISQCEEIAQKHLKENNLLQDVENTVYS